MTEIKLYKSNSKGIKIFVLCLPFVLIGIWMISEKQIGTFDYYMGWFNASFFGLGIPVSIFNLLDRRAQIVINENGIWDRTTKQKEIKWEQIKESYLIEIYNQRYISIVADETFVFKKNAFTWLNKLNKYVGAQELNINLSQIKIDENKLTEFINTLRISEKHQRNNLIKSLNSNITLNSVSNTQKYFTYSLLLACMLISSLNNFYVFWVIMIVMGIGGLIAKWYRGTNNNSNLRKYSELLAYLGLTNMVLMLLIFKTYDYTSNNVGLEMSNRIETYKTKYGKYPNEVKTITEKLNFNLIQEYVADKIVYRKTENDYILKLKFLNQNVKEFDSEMKEWN
jgi:hypothetical protein